MAGMIDLDAEIKVAEEFWNFLGGENAYQNLLNSFRRAGIDMQDEIDNYFKRFKYYELNQQTETCTPQEESQ